MTLRLLLPWVCGLCLTVGLALSGSAAAHAQAAPDPNDNASRNPLAGLQFDTQVGVRIEPPAIPDQNSWSWHRLRGPLDAPPTSLSEVIPQIVAQTRVYAPGAEDEGAPERVLRRHPRRLAQSLLPLYRPRQARHPPGRLRGPPLVRRLHSLRCPPR